MRHHSLTDAAFAALGAGRPDLATIRELRRAQLGRHLLLLRQIVRAAPGRTSAWYAGLAAAQQHDPARIHRLLADPLFGAWAAHAVRTGVTGDLPQPRPAGPDRHLSATHDGRTLRIRLAVSDRLGLTPRDRLSPAELAHWQSCLTEAWRILVGRHGPAAEILAAVVDVVVPVEPDPAARGISATSADAFGAVAMSAPEDGTSLAVGLLHEAQHSILNATQYLFDLHRRPHELGYSPWRDDPRPASGILHGAYAYLAVTRFWQAESGPLAAFEHARWRAAVADAATRLLDRGTLTAAGRRFVGALVAEVGRWPEPGGDVGRLAHTANVDHRLRWRLRNLRVDPVSGESRIVPAPRRELESSARLDLIHASLSGNQPGARTSAGDVALIAGDYCAARRAYEEKILEEPGDTAAWTGRAIATGRTDRLEVEFAREAARRE